MIFVCKKPICNTSYTRRFCLSVRVYALEKKEAMRCNKALTFITFQLLRFNRRCWLVIRYSRRKNYQRTEQSGDSWFCAVGANRRDKATSEALEGGLRGRVSNEIVDVFFVGSRAGRPSRGGIAMFSRPQKLVNVRRNCGICRNDKALRRRTAAPFEKALFSRRLIKLVIWQRAKIED